VTRFYKRHAGNQAPARARDFWGATIREPKSREAEIDDERVWLALRTAQVDHLVRSLPAELGAIVGERGGRLSGRTSATGDRATYGDPEVLVIDEATSDLNPVTEAAIVEVVAGLRGKKTRASGGFREKL
jgi:ABC-type bacteriocin/lantibiotic exporter with double-glycine peptidase domain